MRLTQSAFYHVLMKKCEFWYTPSKKYMPRSLDLSRFLGVAISELMKEKADMSQVPSPLVSNAGYKYGQR